MDDAADLINLSFGSESSTPKGKTTDSGYPLTPNTAQRIITRLSETVNELMEFRQVEYEVNQEHVAETDSKVRDLQDANAIICDCRREIASLKDELKKEKEGLGQQQKDYELKLFRIQTELDQKNVEILGLRKDKSEFDYRMELFESRHARKIEELTQALKHARGTDSHVETSQVKILKAEITDSQSQIDNLLELLAIQTARADQLSAAFADAITSFAQDAADFEQFLSGCNIQECLKFDETDLPEFDASVIIPMLNFEEFEFSVFKSLDDEEMNEMISPAREAISGAMAWARELITLWSHERTESLMLKNEPVDLELELGIDQDEMDEVQIKNESGMTTYMSAAEDFVETVLASENTLEDFAKEFADYLIENQVFHPDDVPPRDTDVFNFLLDRYLFLIETYNNARTEFAEKVKELEEEHNVHVAKTEALISQISQLETSDSTLCDTSVTEGSLDLQRDAWNYHESTVADDSLCATMLADATRDPLEMTVEKIKNTPEQLRMSLRTPQSRIPVGRSTPATKSRPSFIPSTPRIDEEPSMTQNPASIIKTPLQRILRDEVCSTAKKSVTFKSPLLARAEIEAENARLKAALAEKLETIRAMDHAVQLRMDSAAQLEERVEQLEATAASASQSLERTESEYSAKREALEKELTEVSGRLHELTNKLVVEAINLDPSLETRLRNQAPAYVLTLLLDTIITRFKKAQDDEKLAFEKERQEHSAEILKFAGTTELLEMRIDELTVELVELSKDAERRQLEQAELEDKISALEEDVLRLTTDNRLLERDNAQLNKECMEIKAKMSDAQETGKEIESLKLALEATETEKNVLKSENAQLEEEVTGLELARNELKEQNLKLLAEISSAKDEAILTLKQEAIQLAAEYEARKIELANLKLKLAIIAKLENDMQSSLERIAQQETVITGLEGKLSQLQDDKDKEIVGQVMLREKAIDELAQLKRETDEEIVKFLAVIDGLNASIRDKEASLAEMNSEVVNLKLEAEKHAISQVHIDSLKEENNSMGQQLNEALKEKSNVAESLAAVQSQLSDTLSRFHAVESEVEGLKTELTEKQESIESLITAKTDSEACVEALKAEIETLCQQTRQEKVDVSHEMDGLRCELTDKEELVKSLTEKLSQAEENFTTGTTELTAEISAISGKLSEIQELYNQATSDLQHTVLKLTDSEACVETLKAEIEILSQQTGKEKVDLSHEMDGLRCELNDKEELVKSLTEKLSQAEENFTTGTTELTAEISAISGKLSEIQELYNQATSDLQHTVLKLTDSEACVETLKAEIETLSQQTGKEKVDLSHEMDGLRCELNDKEELVKSLTDSNKELAEKLSQAEKNFTTSAAEKTAIAEKLSETEEAYKLVSKQHDVLKAELDSLTDAKNDLAGKLFETEEVLTSTKSELLAKKTVLAEQLSEIEQAYSSAKSDLQRMERMLADLEAANEKLRQENASLGEKLGKETHDLTDANALIVELENQLAQFKLTEGAILRKLADKQASDEAAMRLRAELNDLKVSWDQQQTELETLRQTESTVERLNTSLEKNRGMVKDLEIQIGAVSDLNRKVEALSANNTELCSVLEEIQQVLRLPKEAVQNLTMDMNTKSCLRMFRENVNRELNGLWSEREATMNENQRLSIEVEKLTSEKVQFQIKSAELDAFGKSQEEQIHALSGKLARLEASMSRRSRRSDPIGPRRLEKLEEMNKTLHDLIVGVINALQMPNAEKMRLISQREIDAAAKQILDHAGKIANSCNTLKDQIKTLDQENQELSDNMEKLLKDNSRLEMKVLETEKSSSNCCTVCADFKASLLAKTDKLTKMEADVVELKTKINELDHENEELSATVEALLKDNSKLEMEILAINQNGSSKDCGSCTTLKNKISSLENEVKSLKLKAEDHTATLEEDLKTLREKCGELEASLKDKEEQLLRAVNNIARPDEIRMRGSSCGLTQEVTQNEKIRALTKDNNLLKELLRQRAQAIKKLEAELKRSSEEQVVMNSNSINSPIRERKSGSLRTRGDVAAAYKRALRPGKSQGIENIY